MKKSTFEIQTKQGKTFKTVKTISIESGEDFYKNVVSKAENIFYKDTKVEVRIICDDEVRCSFYKPKKRVRAKDEDITE